MKLSTLALGTVALLAASNFAIAADTPSDAATPAPATSNTAAPEGDAATAKPMDETTDKTTNKTANKEKTKDKTKGSAASNRPVSVQGRCAAKLGHALGDSKWELKGDKADKAYFACVAKAER